MTGKSLTRFLGVSIITVGLLGGANTAKAADFSFFGSGRINVLEGTPIAKLETTPEYIRSVPPHKIDIINDGITSAPIIDDTRLVLSSQNIGIEGKMGLRIKEKNVNFRIGPKVNFNINGIAENMGRYVSSAGDIFTYYGLGMGNQDSRWAITPGAFANSSIGINKSTNLLNFFAEYSADWYEFLIATGWDRGSGVKYHLQEVKETYKLADSINHTIKMGFDWIWDSDILRDGKELLQGHARLFAGAIIPQIINQTSLGDETKFNVSPSVYFGLDYGIDLK
jgi:hypothetical protein